MKKLNKTLTITEQEYQKTKEFLKEALQFRVSYNDSQIVMANSTIEGMRNIIANALMFFLRFGDE